MSFPSVISVSISVARYVVEAHAVLPAPADVLNWALPLVEANPITPAKGVRKAKTAAAEVAAPTKAVRKAKGALSETLLAPVDATATATATVAVTVAPTTADPLKGHKYRLQTVDAALCVARKIDQKNPIPGTRKGDEGATKMYWPEKQCSRKPMPGQPLCKQCTEKEDDVKAEREYKDWYGRLDQPIIHTAMVIGCGQFFEKYPKGLLNDPTTAPPAAPAAAAPTAPATAAAPAAKKTRVTKAKTLPAAESVAVTDEAVPEAKWETFLHESRPLIRNLKSQKVYEVNPHKTTHEDMVLRDKCVGRWVDGALDPYAAGDDSDEE